MDIIKIIKEKISNEIPAGKRLKSAELIPYLNPAKTLLKPDRFIIRNKGRKKIPGIKLEWANENKAPRSPP